MTIRRKVIKDNIFDLQIAVQLNGSVKEFHSYMERFFSQALPIEQMDNSEGLFLDNGRSMGIWVQKQDADLIAHEIQHAINYISTYLRIPIADNNEFQSCYAAFLTRSIYSLGGMKWKY